MIKLLLVLLLIPSLTFGAYTEFYCQSGGSNVNAGSTNNNTAAYTSTNGNWNGSTIFTPTDGSTPASSVNVGDFVSVYVDGATTAVFVARVTTVAAGANGAITVSSTVKIGSAPTSSATGRSIKAGGAWAGPSGVLGFPTNLSGNFRILTNTSSDAPRINLKNDQTYIFTGNTNFTNPAGVQIQGYTTTPGDGGKATFSTSSATCALSFNGTGLVLADLIFVSTAASGTAAFVNLVTSGITGIRLVSHGCRMSGFTIQSAVMLIECEAYDSNKGNNAGQGGFYISGGTCVLINCYSHDNTSGSNADGFVCDEGGIAAFNCIAENNSGQGFNTLSTGGAGPNVLMNCDAYNNTGDGVKFAAFPSSGQVNLTVINSNLIKNGGSGINVTRAGTIGYSYNNGYGTGTQANGSVDTLTSMVEIGKVTYASGVTPWADPANGDFRINLPAAMGVGRGAFTETDGTNTGTVGYPDIGAAQHQDTCFGLGPCQTSGASAQ